LPWTEKEIKSALKSVPKNELILGIPLYSRVWEEKTDGTVTSKALGMTLSKKWVNIHKTSMTLDPETKQNYVRVKSGSTVYEMWLEDNISLTERVHLEQNYGLAGLGSWEYNFANSSTWKEIQKAEKTK
jgi:spore germination protein YaaH